MAKRENFVFHFVFLAFTAFCASRVGGNTFRPVRNHIAPHDQVTEFNGIKRLERGNRVFVDQVFGPESLEFDVHGRGPYTGLADGRIVRWLGKDLGWHTFALVTRNWSEKMCANGINSTTSMQWRVEAHCGRPLGLRFDRKSGDLYIADAYYGLMVVGPKGGFARSLAADVAGKPILFTNDLDIHRNGSVFFTSSSQKYNRVNISLILSEGDASGRLLRYDPPTRKTHVVLDGLAYPNGVQLSKDQSFVLFSETSNLRVMKLWLEGSKRFTTDLVTYVPGFPDNVRMNEKGEFWMAVDCFQEKEYKILANNPESDEISVFSMITRFNEKGETLDVLEDTKGQLMETISEVRQVNGKLWLGTVAHNYIVTFDFGP